MFSCDYLELDTSCICYDVCTEVFAFVSEHFEIGCSYTVSQETSQLWHILASRCRDWL